MTWLNARAKMFGIVWPTLTFATRSLQKSRLFLLPDDDHTPISSTFCHSSILHLLALPSSSPRSYEARLLERSLRVVMASPPFILCLSPLSFSHRPPVSLHRPLLCPRHPLFSTRRSLFSPRLISLSRHHTRVPPPPSTAYPVNVFVSPLCPLRILILGRDDSQVENTGCAVPKGYLHVRSPFFLYVYFYSSVLYFVRFLFAIFRLMF